jgi:hypothetical protein
MFDNNLFDKAFNLFSRVEKQDFEYVYRGYFTHNITKKILVLADTNIQKAVARATIQKRIYYIMVEGLQNITRHQDEVNYETDKYPGIFAIQKRKKKYFVTTGNLVLNDKIPSLKEKIAKINSLEKDELKKFHKEVLSTGIMSDKGGAGLGLIEMARKSDNKLISSFELVNEEYSYFYLQTLVPTISDDEEQDEEQDNSMRKYLISIKKLHLSLNIENILLYFNGFFNQENLLSLLAIIKGRMNMSITTIRLSNVMVEMIQNIIKHGQQTDETIEGVPGIFFLAQQEESFTLTSGNFVKDSSRDYIKERLEFVNGMSDEQLSEYYDKILLDFELGDAKKTGLGFSDLRIKSGRKLTYNFHKVEDENYFYILQTEVTNKKK